MKSRNGIALITTLVLALIALAFTGAMLYMLTSGTRMSGVERRYTTALEAAKGASDYIMRQMVDGTLSCSIPDCNPPQGGRTPINLGQFSNLGGYQVQAWVLSKTQEGGNIVYAVEVEATNATISQKATVDFVYKLK